MQKTTWTIQSYDANHDTEAVFALWQATTGEHWPIEMRRFQQVLAGPSPQHFVAREDGRVVGFVATLRSQRPDGWTGHLLALLVVPSCQGRGLGSALYEQALTYLRQAGMRYLQLGGLTPRFWCGVPGNLLPAQTFFQHRDWDLSGVVYDLVQDLHHYSTPPAIYQRMVTEHITIEPASQSDREAILAFEEREFPNWLAQYQYCTRLGDDQDLLVARDQRDGRVVGTTLIYTPQSHPDRADLIWQSLLGQDAGALGAVGVASAERGRGIGIALVARASDILRARGVGNCYIDWVVLTDFYARLGYEKWRSYHTSWREL